MTSKSSVRITLTARGPAGQESTAVVLADSVVRFGRSPKNGWAIPWDTQISREHADVQCVDGCLRVKCTESAANPIVRSGKPHREIVIGPGESFRIGVTEFRADFSTTANALTVTSSDDEFYSASSPSAAASETHNELIDEWDQLPARAAGDVEEHTFAINEISRAQFENPSRQIELLANLPNLISTSESDVDLALKLVALLLDAIPQAVAVAVVQYDESVVSKLRSTEGDSFDLPKPVLMRVQVRENYEGRFVPSRRLLSQAMKLNKSNVHIWAGGAGAAQFTMSDSLNWAFCTPITADSCTGWCLYVSGEGGKDGNPLLSADDLKSDLRFTELLAQFIGSIRQVRLLQEHKTQLSSFFSPKVIQNLTGRSADEVLKPSERDITVMFCDVRGFSKKAELYRNDLHNLLRFVRAALGAMTAGIMEFDGTIADFQGDAALGFWGWPVSLPDGPIPACRAALAVQEKFKQSPEAGGLLQGFTVGIGIAHGRAIAGQIGTNQQAKVGVFGPVVNQGSRLEGLTAQIGVGTCVDDVTATIVRQHLPRDTARVRKLAIVRPKGMDTPLAVSELLPPFGPLSSMSDTEIEQHEAAVSAVVRGQWSTALKLIEQLPEDRASQFLIDQMALHNNRPPADWDGAFSLAQK